MRAAFVLLAVAACGNKHDDNKAAPEPSNPSPAAKPSEEGAGVDRTVPSPSGHELPYKLKPIDRAEAQNLATLKDRTKSAVKDWLSEEVTADGWIATYSSPHLDNVQDERGQVERKEVGLEYGVYVRRMIDGKPYKCVATHLPNFEDIAPIVAACKTAMPEAPSP
jgi:hypothetical protein